MDGNLLLEGRQAAMRKLTVLKMHNAIVPCNQVTK